LLDEFLPKVLVVRNQFERRWQAEVVPVIGQQLHAERVNRAEERAIESAHHFGREFVFENLLASTLLHLVRCAIRKSYDNETGQDISRVWGAGDLQNAICDGARLPRTGRSYDGKITVEFIRESTSVGLVA